MMASVAHVTPELAVRGMPGPVGLFTAVLTARVMLALEVMPIVVREGLVIPELADHFMQAPVAMPIAELVGHVTPDRAGRVMQIFMG